MSDERLRELERRWKETGDVEDEAALLAERERAGQLTPEALSAAAFLGHPAACRLRDTKSEWKLKPHFKPFTDLAEQLAPWGQEAAVRVALAFVRQVDPRARVTRAAEAWLKCPCGAHRIDAAKAAESATESNQDRIRSSPGIVRHGNTMSKMFCMPHVARAAARPLEDDPPDDAVALAWDDATKVFNHLKNASSTDDLDGALRAELLAWLLA